MHHEIVIFLNNCIDAAYIKPFIAGRISSRKLIFLWA